MRRRHGWRVTLGAALIAISSVASSCGLLEDSNGPLPAGIDLPTRVEPSSEPPAPPYGEVLERFDYLPEAFHEPASAVAIMFGEPFFVPPINFVDPDEFAFESNGPNQRLGRAQHAFGLAIDDDIGTRRATVDGDVFAYVEFRQGLTWPAANGVAPERLSHRERVIAVHEFVHLASFNNVRVLNRATDQAIYVELAVLRAISEGEAEYYASEYFLNMPEAAREDVRNESEIADADRNTRTMSIADAEWQASYALGLAMFSAAEVNLAQDGVERSLPEVVDWVVNDLPIPNMQSLLDPWGYFDNPFEVDIVDEPNGSIPLPGDPSDRFFNAFHYYLMLSSVLHEADALEIARSTTSISLIGQLETDGDCFTFGIRGRDLPNLEEAFESWAQADAQHRAVERVDDTVELTACVPPDDSAYALTPMRALHYASAVIAGETEAEQQGVDRRRGWCAADVYFDAVVEPDVRPSPDEQFVYNSIVDQLVGHCADLS